MINSFIGGYLNFLVVFLCLRVFSPVTALIALAAAAASFVFLLVISWYSTKNAPVECEGEPRYDRIDPGIRKRTFGRKILRTERSVHAGAFRCGR